MKFLNKVIAASLLTVGLLTGTANSSTLEEVVNASYRLENSKGSTCSGTFVNSPKGEQVFATSAHCVIDLGVPYYNTKPEGEFLIKKVTKDETLRPSVEHVFYLDVPVANNGLYYIFPELDIALLKLRNSVVRFPTVDLLTNEEADKLSVIGTKVTVVGYPLGFEATHTRGEFSSKERSMKKGINSIVYRYTAPSTYGNSGGGLYAELPNQDYKYMGTVSHLIDGTFGKGIPMGFLNYAIPVKQLNEVLTFVDTFGFASNE